MLLVRNIWVPCPTNMSAPPIKNGRSLGGSCPLGWFRRSTFPWNICCPSRGGHVPGRCGEVPPLVGSQKPRRCHLGSFSVACSITPPGLQPPRKAICNRFGDDMEKIFSKLILLLPLRLHSLYVWPCHNIYVPIDQRRGPSRPVPSACEHPISYNIPTVPDRENLDVIKIL